MNKPKQRLHEEMYRVDELSSIVQAQDEHKLRLEEARINAENAQHVVVEDLTQRLHEAEEANRETSRKFEKEKQDLTTSRQEAVLQYEFACTQHNDDIRAIRQDNQRLTRATARGVPDER